MPEVPKEEVMRNEKPVFIGSVRQPIEEDLVSVQLILEAWIRDSETHELKAEEMRGVMEAIRASIAGQGDYQYLVAEEEERVIGVIGFRPIVDEKLRVFAVTDNPAELVDAYVDPPNRAGRGVGKALFENIEQAARSQGFKEVLLNSGPRYKDTAWGFYNKIYGEPVGSIPNMYGEGLNSVVWRRVLI